MTGTVILLKASFGFILPDGCEDQRRDSHFFHAEDLVDVAFSGLQVGSRVNFTPTPNDRGLRAENVSLATR